MKCLNIGCGNRYLAEWVNIDDCKSGEEVIKHNILSGLPFLDGEFDVVYHSHVLEHLPRAKAGSFVGECFRVLKPGGILRVAVPDLERIVNEYLNNLEAAKAGDKRAVLKYRWSVIELFDQTVRESSGGEMGRFWAQELVPVEDYVKERVGWEFVQYREHLKRHPSRENYGQERRASILRRFLRLGGLKDKLLIWLTGDTNVRENLRRGRFRGSGEVHQWMYDEYSLGELLKSVGFKHTERKDAFSSSISNWENYRWLDVEGGRVRKPDSLFVEAMK